MLQNHIHLGLTLTGSPEFSPLYKWAVIYPNYQDMPDVIVGLKRGISGKLFKHRLQVAGTAIKFDNYRMTIKVAADDTYTLQQRIAQIKAMNGESVYFCDIDHADDGTDHTADVKTMFLRITSTGKPYTPMIVRYDYEIELTDDYTVV